MDMQIILIFIVFYLFFSHLYQWQGAQPNE